MIELRRAGIKAKAQMPISVMYDQETIGEYTADILVENQVIVEIKAARVLLSDHEAQLLNYLKATKIEVGLLVNFGPKPEIRRRAFDNKRKNLR
jgi:GxxExxY protein